MNDNLKDDTTKNPLSTEHDDSLIKALVEHSRAPSPFEYSENPPPNESTDSNLNESISIEETLEEHPDLLNETPPNDENETNDNESNGEPSKNSPPEENVDSHNDSTDELEDDTEHTDEVLELNETEETEFVTGVTEIILTQPSTPSRTPQTPAAPFTHSANFSSPSVVEKVAMFNNLTEQHTKKKETPHRPP